MDIKNIKQTSAVLSAGQSSQDSHEVNIQKQILNLQEKMRGITYDSEMSTEEKSDEKKALQEKIQNLNNELKQYQIQKRQEEAQKRQEEAAKKQAEEERKPGETTTSATQSSNNTASEQSTGSVAASAEKQTGEPESGFNNTTSTTMFSTATNKEHLAQMQKIRTNLEGQMRTASTDEQKTKLQKKIDNVAKTIGEKIRKIADAIADTQKDDKVRKERVQKQLEEYREKTKNVSASVPKTGSISGKGKYWKDDSDMPGKVLITRKKS